MYQKPNSSKSDYLNVLMTTTYCNALEILQTNTKHKKYKNLNVWLCSWKLSIVLGFSVNFTITDVYYSLNNFCVVVNRKIQTTPLHPVIFRESRFLLFFTNSTVMRLGSETSLVLVSTRSLSTLKIWALAEKQHLTKVKRSHRSADAPVTYFRNKLYSVKRHESLTKEIQ